MVQGIDIFSLDMAQRRKEAAREIVQDIIGGNTAQFDALKADDSEEDEGE